MNSSLKYLLKDNLFELEIYIMLKSVKCEQLKIIE